MPAYSIDALASEWSVTPNAIHAEIAAGRLASFEVNGEIRIAEEEVRAFVSRSRRRAIPDVRVEHIRKVARGFAFRWPAAEGKELYSEQWRADLFTVDGKHDLRVGRTERKAMGRMRRYLVAFVDGKPVVELVGADNPSSGVALTVVKDARGRLVRSRDAAPGAYAGFDLVDYRDYVTGKWARRCVAVCVKALDIESIGRLAHVRLEMQLERSSLRRSRAA